MRGRRVRRWWRSRLTGALDPLRRWFDSRPEKHRQLRRRLNQARYGMTYDDYLTRVAVTAVTAGLLVGGAVLVVLEGLDVLARTLVTAGIALAAGVATAVVVWTVGYRWPRRVARRRALKLDAMLPSAISYMYALAHGGLDPIEVVRRTARREDTYGEQAREMRMVVNDVEYLGTDFVTALDNAAGLTPCEATSDFFGDMVGVLESGGDFEAFLDDRRRQSMDELTSSQESYLEQVGLFSELYVGGLVAGPLFLIIVLLVIGILGSPTLGAVSAVVYVGLPLGTALAVLGLDLLNAPFEQTKATGSADPERLPVPDDPDARSYASRKRRSERIRRLKRSPDAFVRTPELSLLLTVPLAGLAVAGLVLAGLVEPSGEALRARPLRTTGLVGVLPFLVVTVPLAGFYRARRRYTDRVQQRFPDVLSSIARANRSGISTTEAIRMEAERSDDVVGRELRQLYNDVRWFDDPSEGFLRLADRARLRLTSRTMRLIAEANQASGNIHRTLSVAAEEASFRRQFVESRTRDVASYVAVAVISFLVFLGIILLIQQFYLERIVEAGARTAESALAPGMPGSLRNIDVEGFRVVFLHAALIQGACIGFVTGKLSRGSVLAGVTYSVLLVLVSFAVFWVVATGVVV